MNERFREQPTCGKSAKQRKNEEGKRSWNGSQLSRKFIKSIRRQLKSNYSGLINEFGLIYCRLPFPNSFLRFIKVKRRNLFTVIIFPQSMQSANFLISIPFHYWNSFNDWMSSISKFISLIGIENWNWNCGIADCSIMFY